MQRANLAIQNYVLTLVPNLAQAQALIPMQGNNNELYAQIEKAIWSTFEVGARSTMRPVFRSLYLANIDAEHPYPVN